jgi:hypothetical protein
MAGRKVPQEKNIKKISFSLPLLKHFKNGFRKPHHTFFFRAFFSAIGRFSPMS